MTEKLIKSENLYQVTDLPGFTPDISRLICMMNYVREMTLHSVKGLSVKELDHLHDSESNSIGVLLLHFASTEFFYQKFTFEERELNKAENLKWEAAMYLGKKAQKEIRGFDLNYYTGILSDIRNKTLELLKEKNDEWLEKKVNYGKFIANNHHLWFHVFEDEINHRGQINWLRKRLKII